MALNPIGSGSELNSWNYSKPAEPGYSLKLAGTVAAIQEAQAMEFGPGGKPTGKGKTWTDGNPKMNIRIVLVGPSGGYRSFTFQPASKAQKEAWMNKQGKPALHLQLFDIAGGVDMMNLVGKTIEIETEAPPEGFSYGLGKPRPWTAKEVEIEGAPFSPSSPLPQIFSIPQVFVDDAASGGKLNTPAAQPDTPAYDESIPF